MPTGIAHGELRTWTARNGKYTVVAEFVTGDELSVTLGRDGKQRTVPLTALCKADQRFVRDALATAKASEASPIVSAGSAGKEPAAPEPLTVFGIKAGMTFQEIVPILKARGMRLRVTSQPASFLNNSHLNNGATQGLSYVRNAIAERQDGQILTKLDMYFCEDLPDRPGVSICEKVTFTKYYGGKGSPDLSPWFRQARDEFVQRYGPPMDDDETYPAWGHHDSESLQLNGSMSREVSVCLKSMDVDRRSAKGREILIERFRPPAPEIKIDF